MSKHISASKRGFCLYIVAFYLFQIRKRNVLHTIKLRYLELSYLKLKFFYLGYCFQSFSSSDLQPWTSQKFLVNYTNKKTPEIELIGKVFLLEYLSVLWGRFHVQALNCPPLSEQLKDYWKQRKTVPWIVKVLPWLLAFKQNPLGRGEG